MKGLTDIRDAYKTFDNQGMSETEFIKAVTFAFEYLTEEVKSERADRLIVKNICTLKIDPKQLTWYIFHKIRGSQHDIATTALKKLKNADRAVFERFLSRAIDKDLAWTHHFRRTGTTHPSKGSDGEGDGQDWGDEDRDQKSLGISSGG